MAWYDTVLYEADEESKKDDGRDNEKGNIYANNECNEYDDEDVEKVTKMAMKKWLQLENL